MNPYFESENFTLYKGDAKEILESFPNDSIDLIFADPPYFLSNDGISVKSGKMVSVNKGEWDASKGFNEDQKFHRAWIEAAKDVLTSNGTIWISGTYHSIYACGMALQELKYKLLNEIIWYKPNAAPNISCRYFTASHETLIWAAKNSKSKHVFNYEDMKTGRWDGDLFKNEGKQMRSVWAIPTPGPKEKTEGKHPTQKPLALLERIITASSQQNSTVLDPFTGSSTTGIASLKNGRKFIGIDKSEEFLDLSIRRYRRFIDEENSYL